MDGWSEEEIFFDDEDMSTEEMMWNVFLWYGEALNPVGFIMNPSAKFTPRGLIQTATVGSAAYAAAWVVGNQLSTVSGQGPTFRRMAALKIDAYASTMRWASGGVATGVRYGAHLGRGALRNAGFLGVIASLPWLYENVVVPGAEEIIGSLWPGLDQLKFGQDQ